MASIFPNEGITQIFSIYPKNGTNLPQLYLGFFVSQTPTTVPNRDATGGATPTGWTEASGAGYARIVVPSASLKTCPPEE